MARDHCLHRPCFSPIPCERNLLPYWLLFSVFAAGAFQLRERRDHAITPLFLVAALLVFIMVGLRYEVGGDWYNYLEILDGLRFYDLGETLLLIDPGYGLLNWAANQLGWDIWAVNLACALIFTWGLVHFARRQPNRWLACLVAIPYLVIVVGMGYTRQAVAIALMMMAVVAFTHSRFIRTLVFVFLAVLFHKTALVIIPLLLFTIARSRGMIAGVMLVSTVLLYYIFLGSSLDRLMANYEDANYDSAGAAVRLAMNIVPALIFLPLQRRFGFVEIERKLWRNFALAAVAAAVALFVFESSTAVDRLALYLVPLQVVVFSRLPYMAGLNSSTRFTLIAAVIAYSAAVQFVWLQFAAHADDWLPYQIYTFGEDRVRF
jgi:hypothetical protein